jgi:hypothetical protein
VVVEGGVFHSYSSKERAENETKNSEELWVAQIPKGTWYMRGYNGEVISKKLKIVRRVSSADSNIVGDDSASAFL